MKIFKFLIILVFFSGCTNVDFLKINSRIAVVESQFDKVENILEKYKIQYSLIKYSDLEKKETYSNYDTIFIPSGIELPLKTSVTVMSRGSKLQGMSPQNYYIINYTKTSEYIKNFIKNGGMVYFSGYSVKILERIFSDYTFYAKMPTMGNAGSYTFYPKNSFSNFKIDEFINEYIPYNGWVVVKDVINGENLLSGFCNTPIGKKESILLSLYPYEDGELLFSSIYNKDILSFLTRFSILRTTESSILKRIKNYISFMDQETNNVIPDMVLKNDEIRTYKVKFKKGYNSFYFFSLKPGWQVDIEDDEENIIFSKDSIDENAVIKNFYFKNSGEYFVKVFSNSKNLYEKYYIASAAGLRIFPYYKKALIALIIVLILLAYRFFVRNILNRNRFSEKRTNYHRSNIS